MIPVFFISGFNKVVQSTLPNMLPMLTSIGYKNDQTGDPEESDEYVN